MGMALSIPQYTVADLEQFPDDGNRYELLDGMLIVTPSPRLRHQGIASRLAMRFGNALQVPGSAMVFAPGVVSAPPRTQLEPDVLVVPSRFTLANEWIDVTEHWLAIEVLSRSSRVYDRRYKRDAYLDLGVREVWLVDPQEKCIEATRVRGDVRTYRDTIEWRDPIVPATVSLQLNELFAGLP
jgi:Uma2 family endonuclease